jgi:flagellar motor switch protein FliN
MSSTSNKANPINAAELIELPDLAAAMPSGPALVGANAALLDSIEVTVQVVVGQSRTTLGQLMKLKQADVLTVDRKADYPVDIVVNGNVVARGQLVVVDDAFGVRVTEVALDSKA